MPSAAASSRGPSPAASSSCCSGAANGLLPQALLDPAQGGLGARSARTAARPGSPTRPSRTSSPAATARSATRARSGTPAAARAASSASTGSIGCGVGPPLHGRVQPPGRGQPRLVVDEPRAATRDGRGGTLTGRHDDPERRGVGLRHPAAASDLTGEVGHPVEAADDLGPPSGRTASVEHRRVGVHDDRAHDPARPRVAQEEAVAADDGQRRRESEPHRARAERAHPGLDREGAEMDHDVRGERVRVGGVVHLATGAAASRASSVVVTARREA